MQKFPLPLVLPASAKVQVTQPFGTSQLTLEPEGPGGQPHFHYGVDLVWGPDALVFGTPLVLPADADSISSYLLPPGDKSNTPYINVSLTGASGTKYIMTLAHCSKIELGVSLKAGTEVGLTGNYGLVGGTPSISDPFISSHLHLGLQANGKWVDPLQYFDITKWQIGPARDPANCTPRIQWAVQQLQEILASLIATQK